MGFRGMVKGEKSRIRWVKPPPLHLHQIQIYRPHGHRTRARFDEFGFGKSAMRSLSIVLHWVMSHFSNHQTLLLREMSEMMSAWIKTCR